MARWLTACGPAASRMVSRACGGRVLSERHWRTPPQAKYGSATDDGPRASLRRRATSHTSPQPTVDMWVTLWISASSSVFRRYTAGLGIARERRRAGSRGRSRASFWRRATDPEPHVELWHPPAGSHRDARRLLRWADRWKRRVSRRRARGARVRSLLGRAAPRRSPSLSSRSGAGAPSSRSRRVQGEHDSTPLDREQAPRRAA